MIKKLFGGIVFFFMVFGVFVNECEVIVELNDVM